MLTTLVHINLQQTSGLYEYLSSSSSQVLHFNQTAREEGSSETTRPAPSRPKKRKMVFITTKDSEIKISENGIIQRNYYFRLLTSACFQSIIYCLGSVRTIYRKSEQAGNITVKLINSVFQKQN